MATQVSAAPAVIKIDGQTIRKLSPYGPPFVMLDRVESYDCLQRKLTGIKLVSHNEPFLEGHFPGFPIFPGVLIIECFTQASAALLTLDLLTGLGYSPAEALSAACDRPALKHRLVNSRVKHTVPVYPGDVMVVKTRVVTEESGMYTFRAVAYACGVEATRGQISLKRA